MLRRQRRSGCLAERADAGGNGVSLRLQLRDGNRSRQGVCVVAELQGVCVIAEPMLQVRHFSQGATHIDTCRECVTSADQNYFDDLI